MTDTEFPADDSALRRRAENDIRGSEAAPEEPLSCAETIRLVHELQVHQIELEMQNEELRRTQAQLESSRAQYFDFYNLAPVGYFTLNEKGLILEANVTAAVWLGVGKRDLVDQLLTRFILPEDQDIYYRHHQQLLATRSPQVCELRLTRKDAAPFWVRLDAGATGDDESGSRECRVVVTDITQRKAHETQRKAHEREMTRLNRLYAALSKLNQTIVHVQSREELFREVCRITTERAGFQLAWIGYRENETQRVIPIASAGRKPGYLDEIQVYADDRPEGRGPTGRCIGNNTVCVVHDFERAPDTEPWHAAARKHGLRTVAALPIRFRGMVWGALTAYDSEPDVIQDQEVALLEEVAAAISLALEGLDRESQRKQAEETIRETQKRLALVASGARIGMFDRNIATGDTLWTEQVVVLLGLGTTTTTTSTTSLSLLYHYSDWAARVHPEDLPHVQSEVYRCMSAHTPFDVEYRVVWPDGSVHWIASRGVCRYDQQNEPQRMLGIVMDITERKAAEGELRHAKARAETANQAKSEFLANMSHEIRTPMTAVLGFSDILRTCPELSPSEQRSFLADIQKNGKALLKLIDDILDLSRIEADRLPLEKVDCPLRHIVDDALSAVQPQTEQKRLSLDVDYQFPLPETIHTDPARLRQVLVNLLGNAVKFTEQGGVRISVGCICAADGGGRMRFAVSDTGIGIPAGMIDDIFQPFVQVDASSTRRYGGTGLGLAVSQRLAEALGGEIEVASELGRGSTFTLTIDAGPLRGVRMLQSPQAAPSTEEPLPGKPELPLQGRVLCAEDDAGLQVLLAFLLRKLNLEVDLVENGRAACEMAEQSQAEGRPYELILMDIQMPEMNGYEAIRRLRQQGWQGPIVALTAHAMVDDRAKCLAAGCDDYLSKPVLREELRRILTRYLPRRDEATTAGHHVPMVAIASTAAARTVAPPHVQPIARTTIDQLRTRFVAGLPAQAHILEGLWRAGDRQALGQAAHRLKGTSGAYGLRCLAQAAAAVEGLVTGEGLLSELQPAVQELLKHCSQAGAGTAETVHTPGGYGG